MFDSSRTAFMATMGKQRMEDAGMGDLFDHIDNLLDFDDEAEDALVMVEPCVDKTGAFLLPPLPPRLPPPPVAAAAADGGSAAGAGAGTGEESLESSSNQKPHDVLDIMELEWEPKFLDDSVSFFLDDIDIPISDSIADNVDGEMPQTKANACFRTSSPVSVLEGNNTKCSGNGDSSSSSSSTSTSYLGNSPEPPSVAPMIPARARSKRRRPTTFSPRPIITAPIAATSDPESSGESFPPPPQPKKHKSTKKSPVTAAAAGEEEEEDDDEDERGSPPPTARKCMHCGIQKTPQWRAGPMGPKTLCNACGVRYKSGRLFPEYRPAASPTFVPSLHSNSHKKVVEMRIKATMPSSDGCDLLEYIRRRH